MSLTGCLASFDIILHPSIICGCLVLNEIGGISIYQVMEQHIGFAIWKDTAIWSSGISYICVRGD
jgi:hypothetical protein